MALITATYLMNGPLPCGNQMISVTLTLNSMVKDNLTRPWWRRGRRCAAVDVKSCSSNARIEWWKSTAHERYRLLSIDTASVPSKELQLPRKLLGRIIAARSNHGDFKDYHERFNHTEAELYCSCGAPKSRFHFSFCRIAWKHASHSQGPPSTLIPQLLGTSEGITLLTEWWRRNRFYEDTWAT